MTKKQKQEITKISKEFASGFKEMFGEINGSGWLIADPLSGYLNACGFEHTPKELKACDHHPQIFTFEFPDGSIFIPAGGDLKKLDPACKNWMWID